MLVVTIWECSQPVAVAVGQKMPKNRTQPDFGTLLAAGSEGLVVFLAVWPITDWTDRTTLAAGSNGMTPHTTPLTEGGANMEAGSTNKTLASFDYERTANKEFRLGPQLGVPDIEEDGA